MLETSYDSSSPQTVSQRKSGIGWESLRLLLHLATVYLLVNFSTPWLGGWVHGNLLPLLQTPNTSSAYEFLFSHVLALSVAPALLAGLINARFKHQAATFVWVVPTLVIVYKLATFSFHGSVLYGPSFPAFRYYFGGRFFIPEFHNWRDFWNAAKSNPDMVRGMAQLTFTAPFYASIAYSFAAWISMHIDLPYRVEQKVEQWEESRFGPRENSQTPD